MMMILSEGESPCWRGLVASSPGPLSLLEADAGDGAASPAEGGAGPEPGCRPCSLHFLICGFLSLFPFLFAFDCAGLFGRLAAAGPRPGLQVTEGVIYATITMGMACF